MQLKSLTGCKALDEWKPKEDVFENLKVYNFPMINLKWHETYTDTHTGTLTHI